MKELRNGINSTLFFFANAYSQNIKHLEKEFQIALANEDFHACEMLKNKINKLKK